MKFEKVDSPILGLRLITPDVHKDSRGQFFEGFRIDKFSNKLTPHLLLNKSRSNIKRRFVQDNESISLKGVIRGMHMQVSPNEQSKLVRVVKGKILDIVVDLRKESKTYLHKFSIELDSSSGKMLFIPPGCLHGFLSLEDNTIVLYKVTSYWDPSCERGIKWNDPTINIDWKLKEYNIQNPIVSEKDNTLPSLEEYNSQYNI